MGTWNTGIFQNDIALDVMEEYLNYLKDGCSDSDADRKIIENNLDIINQGGNDACEFWLALAMIEWKYGRLQVSTKNNALKMALDPQYLKIWKDEEKLYNKRISVLNEFVNQIQNIQPTKKQPTRKGVYEDHYILRYIKYAIVIIIVIAIIVCERICPTKSKL